ncbi:MAG: type I DNA topoisomerase [Myxococcales bacterium]|nr:type I DNA topoisomerase [Myxococcales bacterium]MCB9708979.1 type I DNA topoisomerase [Myxococcales bacterium]
MSKSLVIVESPAKAKTIQKYLGKGYTVMASKGHLKDLPKRGGVDFDNDFQETYELIEEKGKAEVLKTIKQTAKNVDEVLLATDPDREGEAIAWHIKEELEKSKIKASISRVLFIEITKKGVQAGIAHPRELDTDLYEAQRTRRVLDRIGGYPLSNLLWRKLAFGLSAGRVQTPALRIIVDRQREIDAFVPVKYWLVDAALVGTQRPSFTAWLESVDGQKLERVSSKPSVDSGELADTYVAELKQAPYTVSKITKRAQKRSAPAPYTTSKLQQDASTRLGMQPKSTMRVAQRLYEGVEVGRGSEAEVVGLITYMRTDSVRVSDDAVTECRDYIKTTYGKDSLPDKPNFFKTKKQNVQDAHEAIRPTRMDLPPEKVQHDLKSEQFRLYKLVWDRFVASQMMPAVYDQTAVEIHAKGKSHLYGLRVSGSVLKVPGWKRVYGALSTELAGEEASAEEMEEGLLPELTEGEALTLVVPPSVQSHAKQTEPPPYFNEASLIKKLEEEGIGRPSTYAEIISKVEARDYVRKVENKLKPTPLGMLVIDRLVGDGFMLADIGFTRKLEDDLDAVAEARAKRIEVLAPFHETLQAKIAKVLEQSGKWWPEPETLDEKCPECGKALMKRWGRNGPFIGCPGYPECKYTRNIPGADDEEGNGSREPEVTAYTCDDCQSPMLKRWGRNGYFLGCSRYPACKHTRNLPLGVHCPKCGGEIVQVKGKARGRPFYGCANYNSPAKCDFRVWQRPVAHPCPKCGTDFLVPSGGKRNPGLKCVKEGCDYHGPMPDANEAKSDDMAATG